MIYDLTGDMSSLVAELIHANSISLDLSRCGAEPCQSSTEPTKEAV